MPEGDSSMDVSGEPWPRSSMRCRPPACVRLAVAATRHCTTGGLPPPHRCCCCSSDTAGRATAAAAAARCRASHAVRKGDPQAEMRRDTICARSIAASGRSPHAASAIWNASSSSFTSELCPGALRYLRNRESTYCF